MITPEEKEYVLAHARVPEHVVPLMSALSQGEPFVRDGYLFLTAEDWLIFIGYPFRGHDETNPGCVLEDLIEKIRPERIWYLGPREISLGRYVCAERESDDYFRLDLRRDPQGTPIGELSADLNRVIRKASRSLAIERGRPLSPEHVCLVGEFLQRENPAPRVRQLYMRMPEYVSRSETAVVLNARDADGHLVAFHVVELAAREFAVYVAGCHSKERYVPHASDLVFWEMVMHAAESNKAYIHLGLGVNRGIRRFKGKWGGYAHLPYELCGFRRASSPARRFLQAIRSGA